jgi:transposase-like protein
MQRRKWDPQLKSKIVLELLEQRVPISEICNKYQLRQSTTAYWLKELHSRAHEIFQPKRANDKVTQLSKENQKLKRIIAELSIELKKTELELKDGGEL